MSAQAVSSDDVLDCTVIVPIFNERPSLRQLVGEIDVALRNAGQSFEIIFVDDGSTDGTWGDLQDLAVEYPTVRAVKLRRNFGKSAALSTGVERARGRLIITMDGDLQDDPAEIPRFIETIGEHDRLVTGWKVNRLDPLSKRLPSKLFNSVTSMASGVKLHDHNCGFKAAPAECYKSISLYGELHRFVPALAHDMGYEVVEIEVKHRRRQHGKSKFGLERYLRGFLDLITVLMITRYRRRPGHFLGGLGVLLGAMGSAILAYLTVVWFVSDEPVGTRPLLTLGVLLVLVSLQLMSVGVIAELIVHRSEIRDRPNLTACEVD